MDDGPHPTHRQNDVLLTCGHITSTVATANSRVVCGPCGQRNDRRRHLHRNRNQAA